MSHFYDHLGPDIKTILLAQVRNVWTHNSTALEGNSLTLGETDFILEEGLTIQGKPLKEKQANFTTYADEDNYSGPHCPDQFLPKLRRNH